MLHAVMRICICHRWTEHYSEALNHPTAAPCPELDGQQSQAVDDPEVSVDAPTLDEVRAAIKKLKFGRAAGQDAIAPEMLKLAIDPTSRILHQLFASVWATGKVPCAWKEGIIIFLYKGKGPRMIPPNHAAMSPRQGFCPCTSQQNRPSAS